MKLIFCILLMILITSDVLSHTQNIKIEKRNGYFCYDGDTCNAIMLGVPDSIKKIKVRIRGIDTPEIKGKCENERKLALKAKDFINDLIKNSTVLYLKDFEWGKYSKGK